MGNIQEALSWENLMDQASDLGIGSGGNYYKLEDGENIVRVLSTPVHSAVYFVNGKPVFQQNADDETKLKTKLNHRFTMYVFCQEKKKIQMAEFGWSIAKAIAEFSKSSQYSFNGLPPYDIIIKKSGSGATNTEYTVTPGRVETPMTKEVIEELAKKQPIKEYIDEKIAKQAAGDNPNATPEEVDAIFGSKKG